MKIEYKETLRYFPYVATIFIYLSELYLYLLDFTSGFFFVNALLLMAILLITFSLIGRKNQLSRYVFVLSAILSFLLLIYELHLILLDEYKYNVTSYSEPEELIKDTGIFILSVKSGEIMGEAVSEQVIRNNNRQFKIYEVTPITNFVRYTSKNNSIFKLIGLKKEDFEQMSMDVKTYLKSSNPNIDDFLARENSGGSSAGLALVLSSLVAEGKLQNDLAIGVTGAINKTGKVKKVISIKEKIQIANENSFSYVIVPIGNLNEAIEVKETLHLPVEIVGVRDVEEAIQIIEQLNIK